MIFIFIYHVVNIKLSPLNVTSYVVLSFIYHVVNIKRKVVLQMVITLDSFIYHVVNIKRYYGNHALLCSKDLYIT